MLIVIQYFQLIFFCYVKSNTLLQKISVLNSFLTAGEYILVFPQVQNNFNLITFIPLYLLSQLITVILLLGVYNIIYPPSSERIQKDIKQFIAKFMEILDKILFVPILGIFLLSMRCTIDEEESQALQCFSSTSTTTDSPTQRPTSSSAASPRSRS